MMPWEYLRTEELDGRVLVVAGFLATRVAGRNVFDLNCGYAPVLKFLPRTFASYTGNDIDPEAIAYLKQTYPWGRWLQCRDDQLPPLEQVDVLLVLGYVSGLASPESKTLTETVMKLVYHHYPEVVVLEVWTRYPGLASFNRLGLWLVEQGYREAGSWRVLPWQKPCGPFAERGVVFWERPKQC